jgi:hypothetical protein
MAGKSKAHATKNSPIDERSAPQLRVNSSENAAVTNARLSSARRPDVHSARAKLSAPWD